MFLPRRFYADALSWSLNGRPWPVSGSVGANGDAIHRSDGLAVRRIPCRSITTPPPPLDDRPIWDLWLSQYRLPLVLASDDLGLFDLLAKAPASAEALCDRFGLARRSIDALLTGLAATGFLGRRDDGTWELTELSRTYLLKDSPYYWVPMLRGPLGNAGENALKANLRSENLGREDRISRRWERGEMTLEDARGGNRRMHSHSLPAAIGLARTIDFSGVRRLLDVAGGSGCFSIQLALANPELRCTIAELPSVATDTRTYIARNGLDDRVDTHPFNMFDDPWPSGYDGIFFSNVFHDWDAHRRSELARKAFAALPAGGRVFLHEMLLNEAQSGPTPAALFSVMMLGTRGKQFSFDELRQLLATAGFRNAVAQPSYGYYSVVSAVRP